LKYLITGLGNPGSEYAHTRHNIGFDVLDALAGASGISFDDKRYGFVADLAWKSRHFFLLKPSTYVNLSGRAVQYYLNKLKIPSENFLVVCDDLALPFGTLRLRPRGGDAGHNGLTSIIQTLGSQNFPRLRFGLGNDFPQGYQAEFVLGHWTDEEKKALPERIETAGNIIKSFGTIGLQFTMNTYNNR
jgi:PTH1 family peptidyl-tRNA hydrolase